MRDGSRYEPPRRTPAPSLERFQIVTVSNALRRTRVALQMDVCLGSALVGLAFCAATSALLATDVLGADPVAFAASVSTIVVTIVIAAACIYGRTEGRPSSVVLSPFAIAAATWLVLFVLRPVELYLYPEHASLALGELGFDSGALTRAVAVAGIGCSAWCLGYIVVLGRWERTVREVVTQRRVHWGFSVAALVVGTFLWGALFVREGGVNALLSSAASLRADQRSSAYGFIGVWIVQGTGLCALATLLAGERRALRPLRAIVVAAAMLSAAAAIALQLRGLAVFAALSALTIVLALRPPSTRKLLAGAAAAAILVAVLAFAQQIRAYTSQMSTTEAARTALHTPPWAHFVSDVGTFDDLVAMRELVPASIPFMHGETLRQIPEALVPRALWPEKPLGVDARAASYLYPGAAVAVPISLQGELYWNNGLLAVVVGSLAVGAAFGALGRLGLGSPAGSGAFLAYAVALPFTHAFLTRGLASMTENLVFALVGLFFAALAAGLRPDAVARFGLTRRRLLRAARSVGDA
jgi:hypothetical protein